MTALVPDSRSPAERTADALADLADCLNELRGWMERGQAKDDAEAAERAERDRRREPAEWQAALDEFRDFVNGVVLGHVPDGFEVSERGQIVQAIVTGLDRRLRDGFYGIRQALETLAAPAPADLRAIAAEKMRDVPAEHRESAIAAFMVGAVYYERG